MENDGGDDKSSNHKIIRLTVWLNESRVGCPTDEGENSVYRESGSGGGGSVRTPPPLHPSYGG